MRYFEEYVCGCVSSVVDRKSKLLGYCGKHGSGTRHVHGMRSQRKWRNPERENDAPRKSDEWMRALGWQDEIKEWVMEAK